MLIMCKPLTLCITLCCGTAGSDWKHCPAMRDETDNCDIFYSYHYNPDIKTVNVQKTKRTSS